MNIFVGNLSHSTTEQELRAAFAAFGAVDSVDLITDRETGNSRGFGFVTLNDPKEAEAAVFGMDGADLGGRTLKVNKAKPRKEPSFSR